MAGSLDTLALKGAGAWGQLIAVSLHAAVPTVASVLKTCFCLSPLPIPNNYVHKVNTCSEVFLVSHMVLGGGKSTQFTIL